MSTTVKNIVRYGVIALGVILIGIFAFRFWSAYQTFQVDMNNADVRIAEYRKDILAETAAVDEKERALAAEKAGVYNMKNVGSAVSILQTKMAVLPASIENASEVEKPSKQEALRRVRDELNEYFSDDESRVWFPASFSTEGVVMWKCITTYDTKQPDLPCVWICYRGTESSTPLAYAYADYDISTQKLSNAKVFYTDYGRSLMLVEDEG